MSKAKATFHSILWNHTGKITEYILMYAASILIARGLGAAENGTFVGLRKSANDVWTIDIQSPNGNGNIKIKFE